MVECHVANQKLPRWKD